MKIEIRKVEKEALLGFFFNELMKVYEHFFKTTVSGFSSAIEDLKNRLSSRESLEHWFLAFDDGKIVGFSLLGHDIPKRKSGWFDVFSLPDFERCALPMLEKVIRTAQENAIEKIRTSTYSKQTWELVESVGGKAMNTSVERTLSLKDYDWSVVDSWLTINGNDWIIKRYGSISEEFVEETAELSFDACNEVWAMDGYPVDDDKAKHVQWLKGLDKLYRDDGLTFVCLTISQKNAVVLGFIEGSISQAEPDFFLQRLVAVKKDERGKGIGKHLKALMLDHLRTGHPEVVRIKTTNNVNNHSAIALNEKLGFQIVGTYRDYRIDVAKAVSS